MLDLDLLVSSFSALSVDFLFWFVAFLTVLNLVGSLKSKLDPWFKYIFAYRSEYFGLTNLDCNLATFRCIFLSFSVLSCCRTRILTVFFFGKYSSNGFGIFDWIKIYRGCAIRACQQLTLSTLPRRFCFHLCQPRKMQCMVLNSFRL